jgi:hypothetical protein
MKKYREIKGVLKVVSIVLLILLVKNIGFVSANGEHIPEEQSVVFPVWTYYAEIFEHGAITIIAIIAMLFLIKEYSKRVMDTKQGILWMIIGLVVLIFSQLLTNLHHYSIFVFGTWNAIVHHGLLTISIIIMLIAFFKILKDV